MPIKILVFLFVFLSIQALPHLKVILNEIPPQDKIALEQFFKLLIREEAFGYTLFGPKPMSIADFSPPSYRFTNLSKSYILEKGWEAWLRNQHHFSTDYFILKREIHKTYGTTHFYLMNKRHLAEMIQYYLDDFRKCFEVTDSPEKIFEKLRGQEGAIHNLSQFLLGVLLGYGEKNACNFEKERQICRSISGKITPPFLMEREFKLLHPMGKELAKNCPLEKSILSPDKKALLVTEFNDLHDQRILFKLANSSSWLDRFSVPSFVCWENCSDTKKIKETYENTRVQIRDAYKNRSFLEVTLQQWISPK